MKILTVRFKNLNSLVGEWEIDFTHPAYASDGIFAIVGPTGSGKTTILDAMCLALYGRTPRLTRIGKNSNELMSRHTGECFAEVLFETQAGQFRCHWSQHRSRRKPEGDLQNPKHEISEAESGKIIEAKLRAVAEKIEQVSGMDFDRFTRSMLLAQGGFSAFLQASADERAPILEQITGTEIYSQISIRVHEKRVGEKKKLELLESGLSGMQLLSGEEELQLKESLVRQRSSENTLNKELEQNRTALNWLQVIVQLEQELVSLHNQKQDLSIRQAEFKDDAERLKQAKRALELTGEYAILSSMRNQQVSENRQLVEFQTQLPEWQVIVSQVEKSLKSAIDNLARRKQEQKEQRIVIQKTRELDIKLVEKESLLAIAETALKEREKSLGEIRDIQGLASNNLNEKKKGFEKLTIQLRDTQADEALIEHLTGIRNRLDMLGELIKRKQNKNDEISEAIQQKIETHSNWGEKTKKLDVLKAELEINQQNYDDLLLQQKKILNGRDISDWRAALSELQEQKTILKNANQAAIAVASFQKKSIELAEKHSALTIEESSLVLAEEKQADQQVACERELQLLETQLSLLKKIEVYEDARDQLQDGEPCPLCGAKDHPFAEGNTLKPDKTTIELSKVKANFKAGNETLSTLKIELAKKQKDLEQLISRQDETKVNIASEDSKLQDSLDSLSLGRADKQVTQDRLNSLQQNNIRTFELTSGTVNAIDELGKKILLARKLLDQAKHIIGQTEHSVHSALNQKEISEQAVTRLQTELSTLSDRISTDKEQALNDISVYGIESLSIDSLDNIQQQLTARRDRRLSLKAEFLACEKQISTLELDIQYQAEKITNAESERKKQKNLISTLRQERDVLFKDRKSNFGDKNTDQEETQLLTVLEQAEESQLNSQIFFDTEKRKLEDLESKIGSVGESIFSRKTKLGDREKSFTERLVLSEFPDEKSYRDACLAEDERTRLITHEQHLMAEHTVLHTRYEDKKSHLAAEKKKKITEQSVESLQKILEMFSNNLKELQQALGGIKQKLSNNEIVRLKQKKRIEAINDQKKEFAQWDTLHLLIGSADGKKYRNFAQGLTFEMMVSHANRQLQKMTGRYLLIRDDVQPLELNVIDSYQAGEIRSTKNLSGGEGFIVSLALALGLSNMASKNVRVDSLFLDEGFGTLDEDALDIALETLAGLQQDGKLIGVISHVSMLKDRISTQISVNPKTGGQSTISGPGCKAVFS